MPFLFLFMMSAITPAAFSDATVDQVHAEFMEPPVDCRPHTRWWWMGNALRKEDITRQLDQMQAQGIGGVEQITMDEIYAKGNHEYLSEEYFDLLKFAVKEAGVRGMRFSINFGGPGWVWGGKWVPKEDQSKNLLASMMPLEGPSTYSGPLPEKAALNPTDVPRSMPFIAKEDRLLNVIAGRVEDGSLRAESIIDLTATVNDRAIEWDVPEGRWQLMAFWMTQRNSTDAVDHLNEGAMSRYCEILGAKYVDAIGEHFGKTVESFFGDSFEVPIYRNGLYWTDGIFERFHQDYGYDLVPMLPALWWDVTRDAANLSPKVRYDVNQFLHEQGMRAFFGTFLSWCERHGVRGRIQPYGFVTDNIEGAGVSDIPEMEITCGEKDAVPWFDTRIGPKQYVASGAHLYGRNIVTTEAFTFIHWEPYRATLEELKAVTDGFLHTGANKFYNHGFLGSPERDIVPSRSFFEAIRISPENIWWPYYHHLADYTARCCHILRQGRFAADVAVYSALANQWASCAINGRKWTREFDWGSLGRLLMSNGYGFDLVNDDMLQRHMTADGQQLRLGEMTYRVLILPDIAAMPLDTLRQVKSYVKQGGAVIALERTPESSTGMRDFADSDEEVRRISREMFAQPVQQYGKGRAFFMKQVMRREDQLDWKSAPLDPFLKALRECVPPDVDIDLVSASLRTNDGLTHIHRRADDMDIYFLTNLQNAPVDLAVGLRVPGGRPVLWDAFSGLRRDILQYARDGQYTRMRLRMQPFESRLIVFEQNGGAREAPHVVRGDFEDVTEATRESFTALARRNGRHSFEFHDGETVKTGSLVVDGLPAPFEVGGAWNVRFQGPDAPDEPFQWQNLVSWTDVPLLRHFSGRATYSLIFDMTENYFAKDIRLRLSLGNVGNVGEIRLNGEPVGVHWMTGREFFITPRPGANTLEIDVTNTLINRVSGLKSFPEIAPDLQPVFGTDMGKPSPRADSLRGFEPLPPSGLLGPVRIIPLKVCSVNP